MPAPIRRILVANRGEIAVRVIRACREMGVSVVAVASDADRFALHAQLADEVVELGGESASDSYLRGDAVIEAGLSTGCDAVHPGYGFLAENPAFARAVAEAGMIFIGPPPEVIEEMGLKTAARARMEKAGVPVVPGALLPVDVDEKAAVEIAGGVGFPLLVKASAGGGGKGMRRVDARQELASALGAARREAESAFGNGEVYLERLLERPRHVEVQVLADAHGKVLHLGERDCSIQRRHQKIIEESPAPGIDDALRARIHDTAVKAASAVGYVNAGTVEMLLDQDGEFYFLEMNTRLQVEHPVTEWVTGLDLVCEQIRVAQGEPLRWEQADIVPTGHSIEARLYAEDPASGFLPQTGEVLLFEAPGGPGVRVDTGIQTATYVGLHYDPMIAKISAWAEDRDAARRRLIEALRETHLLGPTTNLAYLAAILESNAFAGGGVHTGFLEQHMADWSPMGGDEVEAAFLAAAATIFGGGVQASDLAGGDGALIAGPPPGPWSTVGPLRLDAERGA